MQLHEWEIWFTYSTYLTGTLPDLGTAAQMLLARGVGVCAMHSDGRTFWCAPEGVESACAVIDPDRWSERAEAKLIRDGVELEMDNLPEFVREVWLQGIHYRFSEMRLFRDNAALLPPYVRIFLPEHVFVASDERINVKCYPVIKLYESGVILVGLRVLGPSDPMGCDEFVRDYLNQFRTRFNLVITSPGVSRLAVEAYQFGWEKPSFGERVQLPRLQRIHDSNVQALTVRHNGGEFEFDYAPLSVGDGSTDNFQSYSQTIFGIVAYVISRPRRGIAFVFRGQKQLIDVGNCWVGRRHIHLIRFEDQANTASENEKLHGDEFGWILSGTRVNNQSSPKRYLPKNSRHFEDYGAYISSTGALWVWAGESLKIHPDYAEANHAPLVYEHQAVTELLDYTHILYRALWERAVGEGGIDEVLRARRNLALLKKQINETSLSGEIQDLIQDGLAEFDVPRIEAAITESLAIRETEESLAEGRRSDRVGRVLTVLFGIIAVPPIANDVLSPLWDYLKLWRPADANLSKLYLIAVAIGSVTLLTWLLAALSAKVVSSQCKTKRMLR